ncbi:hypothetical protein HHI36_005868 [Cryptolaemus montrouzieri]|uniref:Uncharacterized protein n=1 Tax=Cryptolaemus montrouzieri TaxID=559131 RepID=A0ABD2NVJ9_9CUCU
MAFLIIRTSMNIYGHRQQENSRSLRRVDDVRVYRGAEFGSDHRFIKAKIYFAQYTHMTLPTQEITNEERQCKPKRYKLDPLQDPSVDFLHKLSLSQKITQIDDSTPTKLYDGQVKSIHQAAEESLGELDNGRNKKSLYCWNNSIKESIEEKKRAYDKWSTR